MTSEPSQHSTRASTTNTSELSKERKPPSEISQTDTDKYHMISHVESKKTHRQQNKTTAKTHRNRIEQWLPEAGVKGWGHWVKGVKRYDHLAGR